MILILSFEQGACQSQQNLSARKSILRIHIQMAKQQNLSKKYIFSTHACYTISKQKARHEMGMVIQ
jgi:hypothetical protein